MKVVDLHGYTLEEAFDKVEIIIGDIRQRGKFESVEFITGHGLIKRELPDLLSRYGLIPQIKLGNAGCLIVEIE